MYHPNVLFGMPDQGQTLDVWESQTAESALRCMYYSYAEKPPPQPWVDILNTTRYPCRNLWRYIRLYLLESRKDPFNDCPIRRILYSRWLCSELVRHTTSVLWAQHMGLHRILHDTHLSHLVRWEPFRFISKAYNSFLVSHNTITVQALPVLFLSA